MNPTDTYVYNVLARHQTASSLAIAQSIIGNLSPTIIPWSNGCLDSIKPSGSIAKGTAITGSSDVDLLVSLKSTTTTSLKDIYESLYNHLLQAGYSPKRQNVSLGITLNGWKVDVVPAKKQGQLTFDHSLWSHKLSTWRQTNTHKHVQLVSNSGRVAEIKLTKIWRKLHNLELPSFLLEMSVINALKGHNALSPSANFPKILAYLRDTLPTARIIDPSRSTNIVSDDLTPQEKNHLAIAANNALNARWEQVVW